MSNESEVFEDTPKKQLTIQEELEECKLTIRRLKSKERVFVRKHGEIVAKLHDHIDKIRRSLITSLNLNLPDIEDQIL
tara:strand:+ start:333 stop:566 length:234 start_codon:yes stop_codon:yes gene_type:complete